MEKFFVKLPKRSPLDESSNVNAAIDAADSDSAQLAQGLGIKRMMQIQLVQNVSGVAGVAGDGALLREDISIFHYIDMLSTATTTTTSSDSGNASVQTDCG